MYLQIFAKADLFAVSLLLIFDDNACTITLAIGYTIDSISKKKKLAENPLVTS